MFEATTGNAVLEQQKRDELKAKQQNEVRIKKEVLQHQEKQAKVHELALDRSAAVRGQLAEKDEKRAKEREESNRLREEMENKAAESIEEEKQKVITRKAKAKEHSDFL